MDSNLKTEVVSAAPVKTNDELYEELLKLLDSYNDEESDSEKIRAFINSNRQFPLNYNNNGALYAAATTNKRFAVGVLASNKDVRELEISSDFAVTRATLNINVEFTSSQVIMHFIKKYHTIDPEKLKELGDLVEELQIKKAAEDRGTEDEPTPRKNGFLGFQLKTAAKPAATPQSSLAVANVGVRGGSDSATAQGLQTTRRSRSRFGFCGCM